MAYRKALYKSQDVEVFCQDNWRKAKIVSAKPRTPVLDPGYHVVRFPDGSRDIFNEEFIRPLDEEHNDQT